MHKPGLSTQNWRVCLPMPSSLPSARWLPAEESAAEPLQRGALPTQFWKPGLEGPPAASCPLTPDIHYQVLCILLPKYSLSVPVPLSCVSLVHAHPSALEQGCHFHPAPVIFPLQTEARDINAALSLWLSVHFFSFRSMTPKGPALHTSLTWSHTPLSTLYTPLWAPLTWLFNTNLQAIEGRRFSYR